MRRVLLVPVAVMGFSLASYVAFCSLSFAEGGDESGIIAAPPDPLAEAPDPLAEAPDSLPAADDDALSVGVAEVNSQSQTGGSNTPPASGAQAQNQEVTPPRKASPAPKGIDSKP